MNTTGNFKNSPIIVVPEIRENKRRRATNFRINPANLNLTQITPTKVAQQQMNLYDIYQLSLKKWNLSQQDNYLINNLQFLTESSEVALTKYIPVEIAVLKSIA